MCANVNVNNEAEVFVEMSDAFVIATAKKKSRTSRKRFQGKSDSLIGPFLGVI